MTTQAIQVAKNTIKSAKAELAYYESVKLDLQLGNIPIHPDMCNFWIRNCDKMICICQNQIETFETFIIGTEMILSEKN